MNSQPSISAIDKAIGVLDNSLRVVFSKPNSRRPSPASGDTSDDPIQSDEILKERSASLMRVNHVGEVCAQALYQGQAITSRDPAVQKKMQIAADEEIDHLNWCAQRLEQLDSHPSVFNPLWYAGSLTLGIAAGLAGDKWSLGFLAETERQVVDHLKGHLQRLPSEDHRSRLIVEQMVEDEQQHADMAVHNGAAKLPDWIKVAMRNTARVMTSISEHA